MVLNILSTKAGDDVEENDDQRSKDSQRSSFISEIINSKPESENGMIQPLKSTYAGQNMSNTSSSKENPVEEIFPSREIAKNLNITLPESKEKSEENENGMIQPLKSTYAAEYV